MNSHPTYPVSSTKRGCAAHHRFAVRVPPPSGVGRNHLEAKTSPIVRMGGNPPGFSRGEDVKIRLRYDRLGG